MLVTRSLRMMKLACPPGRWTPRGEDPEAHYRALLKFYKQHYSPQTVLKEFKGLAHAELVMMFPERFAREVNRFLAGLSHTGRDESD